MLKPWYVFRPLQAFRRLFSVRTDRPRLIRLPWGPEFVADPDQPIGLAVLANGVYDLALTEALLRLTPPGGLAIDAGANVGYTASVLAAAAGHRGRVVAFEPHPRAFIELAAHAARWKLAGGFAPIDARPLALSDKPGRLPLHEPESGNHECAAIGGHLMPGGEGRVAAWVPATTLDEEFPRGQIDVLKVDCENHEAEVIRGAAKMLAAGRVRHVLFEAYDGLSGSAATLLRTAEYRVYQLGWKLRGPVLAGRAEPPVGRPSDPPTYLATRSPAAVADALAPRGWRCLNSHG